MNYLAHLYLAENNAESLVGNLLGDFIKGPIDNRYNQEITKGIVLHRKVDSFSDAHPLTLSSRNLFSHARRRYAGIIVDVSYDHFLCKHWQCYSDRALADFIVDVYSVLQQYYAVLPDTLQLILPRMIDEDWLGSYRQMTHVAITLDRISKRIKRTNTLTGSIEEVVLNYEQLEKDFLSFFPELIQYVRDTVASTEDFAGNQ